jgi:hypothetical protein
MKSSILILALMVTASVSAERGYYNSWVEVFDDKEEEEQISEIDEECEDCNIPEKEPE